MFELRSTSQNRRPSQSQSSRNSFKSNFRLGIHPKEQDILIIGKAKIRTSIANKLKQTRPSVATETIQKMRVRVYETSEKGNVCIQNNKFVNIDNKYCEIFFTFLDQVSSLQPGRVQLQSPGKLYKCLEVKF